MVFLPHRTRETTRLLDRIRSEYLEMPGMTLTLAEARRFWNLDERFCQQLLTTLIESGFLRKTWRETFVKA